MDRLLTTINTTITVTPGFDTPPIWTGYISVLVAVLFFGSNLVPAAKYSIRDGFSFQFFLCVGIWITGAVINLIVKSPPFFPLVMIGGVLWTTGNIISVYVISINGLGLSMLLCVFSIGWASGHFGWFGLKPENVDIPAFNYVGVAIACLSGIVFLAIRTRKSKEQLVDSRPIRHFTNSSIINRSFEIAPEGDNEMSSTVNIKMRIIGCSLAILAGILFGLVFTPSTYIQDHQENYPGAVKNGLHYVFAMYTASNEREPDEIWSSHVSLWNQVWLNGRIEIRDDVELQRQVNSALYYILSSLPPLSTRSEHKQFYGLSPGSLSRGAWKTRLILLRIATILCFIMIILCILLIVYDILVLIDPTRCFFLNCGNAQVTYQVNSTYNATITGWPLNITWPNYFQTNMNAKRIFQSIQILCAALFILFCSLYILTYIIYRRINIDQGTSYKSDPHTFVRHETFTSPRKRTDSIVQSFPQYNLNRLVTVYTIEGHPSTVVNYSHSPVPTIANTSTPRKTKRKTVVRPRANSANYDRICTRCMKESRMILTTNYQRQNFFSHLCINCNNEILNYHRKLPLIHSADNRTWKP
ncbi:unnamed protein product [Rotaria sp. Silwood1]|nr:unnamed protein product [Rotaria sp. Silwood1]